MAKGSNQDLRNNCECASLHSAALHVDSVLPGGRRWQGKGANERKTNFFLSTHILIGMHSNSNATPDGCFLTI